MVMLEMGYYIDYDADQLKYIFVISSAVDRSTFQPYLYYSFEYIYRYLGLAVHL